MFEWKPEFSIQIPEIDAQHQRLFALATELHVAMSQGKGQTVVEQSLIRLIDYTKTHFTFEENLMERHKYPETLSHKEQHQKLTAQVLDFQKRFNRKETWLTVDLMLFLKNWLEQHISRSDRKYAAHILRKAA